MVGVTELIDFDVKIHMKTVSIGSKKGVKYSIFAIQFAIM